MEWWHQLYMREQEGEKMTDGVGCWSEPTTVPNRLLCQQEMIEPLIPPAKPGGRPRTLEMREVVNAILCASLRCRRRPLVMHAAPGVTSVAQRLLVLPPLQPGRHLAARSRLFVGAKVIPE